MKIIKNFNNLKIPSDFEIILKKEKYTEEL